jgi:hypothetical protein
MRLPSQSAGVIRRSGPRAGVLLPSGRVFPQAVRRGPIGETGPIFGGAGGGPWRDRYRQPGSERRMQGRRLEVQQRLVLVPVEGIAGLRETGPSFSGAPPV